MKCLDSKQLEYLKDHVGSRFNLQDAAWTEWLKAGVRVIGEGRTVQGTCGCHIIQKEAKLLRVSTPKGQCLLPKYNAWGLA